nr:cytochrome P450 81F3-like [Ipomoea batatas]
MDISLCFLLFAFLYFLTTHFLTNFQNLPPTPSISLPLIGHLYLIKKPLHRTLANISRKHGLVLFLKFGSHPVLLVSSPSAVEQCFTKNDVVLANRPRLLAGKYLGYDYTTLVWASYGPHWRNLRRIASTEVLSAHRIQAFADIRREEVRSLIKRLHRDSGNRAVCKADSHVEMKSYFFELTLNVMMRMIAGKRYYGENVEDIEEAKRFRAIVTDTFRLGGATNVGDFVPALKGVFKELENSLVELQHRRDSFMQDMIKDCRKRMENDGDRHTESAGKKKSFVEVLLSLQENEPEYYKDEIIRSLMLVMLAAGTDTSSGTMEWGLSLLLNHPQVLKKAQREIDERVGHERLLEESDLVNLPYLNCIIKETMRMYPVGPLLIPHESSEECTVAGYRIPAGTMLMVNLYSIQRDPKNWDEPEKFRPERFQGSEGVTRDGYKMMPFGSGRRSCPGESLGLRMVGLSLGSLIQCFDWERIGGEMVDMTEGTGLSMPKATPLTANCKARPFVAGLLSQTA